MLYSFGYMLYPQEKLFFLSYKLNLEPRSIATAIYACCYLSF